MQLEIKRIQGEVGITTIYVTHDQEEALVMSDRIAVMNNGRIEQVDTPKKLYERPATLFVAGFIGESNIMPVTVQQLNGIRRGVLANDVVVPLPSMPLPAGRSDVSLIVRPEGCSLPMKCHLSMSSSTALSPSRSTSGTPPGIECKSGTIWR